MKIVVCIKQVLDKGAPLLLNEDRTSIIVRDLPRSAGEADLYALEMALSLKDRTGAEVVVLTLGGQEALQAVRDALARGADRALHIHCLDGWLEPLQVASALSGRIRAECPDVVLTGVQSGDLGNGQVGIMIAELVEIPAASMITHAETEDGGLKALKELEGGTSQWWHLPMPCVLTVQSGANRPRLAGIKGVMSARKKPVATVEYESDASDGSFVLDHLSPPPVRAGAEWFEGAGYEMIAGLASRILETGRD